MVWEVMSRKAPWEGLILCFFPFDFCLDKDPVNAAMDVCFKGARLEIPSHTEQFFVQLMKGGTSITKMC